MASLSDYLESQLLNHIFRETNFVKPSSIAIALTSGVPIENDNGGTILELPSGVARGSNYITTNYSRLPLGNPTQEGKLIWNTVGTDDTTTFSVYGTSSQGQAVGMSGYFYPLYLNESTAEDKDSETTGQPDKFTYSYVFEEFPATTFYSPKSLAQSGQIEDPGYIQYDGNGFIKNSRQLIFNTAFTDWGWVSGVAIMDTEVHGQGNMLMYAKLSNPRYIFTGDNIKFDINSLEISLK